MRVRSSGQRTSRPVSPAGPGGRLAAAADLAVDRAERAHASRSVASFKVDLETPERSLSVEPGVRGRQHSRANQLTGARYGSQSETFGRRSALCCTARWICVASSAPQQVRQGLAGRRSGTSGGPGRLRGGGSPNSANPAGNGSAGTGNPSLNAVGAARAEMAGTYREFQTPEPRGASSLVMVVSPAQRPMRLAVPRQPPAKRRLAPRPQHRSRALPRRRLLGPPVCIAQPQSTNRIFLTRQAKR